MSNNFYETSTPYKQGVAILKSDLVPNVIFELGEPAQSISGLNGFLMEVSADGLEGVMDVSPTQIYNADTLLTAGNKEVGTKIYYDPATGALTDTVVGEVFGKLVRVSHDDVFPVVGGATANINVLLVN